MESGTAASGVGLRVLSLLPSATDTVIALGMEGLLVGRSHEASDWRQQQQQQLSGDVVDRGCRTLA